MITKFVLFFVAVSIFFATVMFVSGGHYDSGNAYMAFNDCLDVVFKKQWMYSAGGALCLCFIVSRLGKAQD
jgi:hypothetical protein